MKRPNILVLYTDQQRWDALGANGNRQIKTPHMDGLAAEGLNYDHHFVQNPVCMPSRLSFLAGQYPSTLRITHMAVPVPEDTVILPHLLRNYGYRSANIGKLHFLPHANRDHRQPHPAYGFDHLEISDEPGCYEDAYRAWVRRTAPEQLDKVSLGLPPMAGFWNEKMGYKDTVPHPPERFDHFVGPFRGASNMTHSAFVAEQTCEYLRAQRDGPFLCIAGFYNPHAPWVVPQEYLDLYDPAAMPVPLFPPELDARRAGKPGLPANNPDQLMAGLDDACLRRVRQGYYAMVSEVDHHVGRILACLRELGIADDTIVVFISDHGEFMGEHLRYGKGYPAPDCISRVPLIVRYPRGISRPGKTISEIVEAVDVLPTLLEWAGIPVPAHLQGLPLPTAEGQSGRASALLECAGWKALRTREHRYISKADGGEVLIELAGDPGEYHNLAADPGHAAALSDCRREMLRRLIAMERPLPRTWPY